MIQNELMEPPYSNVGANLRIPTKRKDLLNELEATKNTMAQVRRDANSDLASLKTKRDANIQFGTQHTKTVKAATETMVDHSPRTPSDFSFRVLDLLSIQFYCFSNLRFVISSFSDPGSDSNT